MSFRSQLFVWQLSMYSFHKVSCYSGCFHAIQPAFKPFGLVSKWDHFALYNWKWANQFKNWMTGLGNVCKISTQCFWTKHLSVQWVKLHWINCMVKFAISLQHIYIYIHHILIVWVWFLWSCPQNTSLVLLVRPGAIDVWKRLYKSRNGAGAVQAWSC